MLKPNSTPYCNLVQQLDPLFCLTCQKALALVQNRKIHLPGKVHFSSTETSGWEEKCFWRVEKLHCCRCVFGDAVWFALWAAVYLSAVQPSRMAAGPRVSWEQHNGELLTKGFGLNAVVLHRLHAYCSLQGTMKPAQGGVVWTSCVFLSCICQENLEK